MRSTRRHGTRSKGHRDKSPIHNAHSSQSTSRSYHHILHTKSPLPNQRPIRTHNYSHQILRKQSTRSHSHTSTPVQQRNTPVTTLASRDVHHLQSIPTRPRLITLDVTGTLLTPSQSIGVFYQRAAHKLGISITDPQALQKAFKKAYIEIDQLHPHFGADDLSSSREWWYKCVKKTFYNMGLNLPYRQQDALFEQIYSDFGIPSSYKVYPDVFPFLSSIQEYNKTVIPRERVVVGVLSNGDDRYQDHTLPMVNIHPFLDFTLVSYRENLSKPNPLFFDRAIEKANQILSYMIPSHETMVPIEPHEALHIGNSLPLDYLAALQTGSQAALLLRRPEDDLPCKPTTTYHIDSTTVEVSTKTPLVQPQYMSESDDYDAMISSLTGLLDKHHVDDRNPYNYDVYRTLLDVRDIYLPEIGRVFPQTQTDHIIPTYNTVM